MKVYLDHAATTPVDKQVLNAMLPYFGEIFGNASEFHLFGVKAREAVENARQSIAHFLGAQREEITFTSCATESINLVHKGFIEGLLQSWKESKKPHIITSSIEHKAVLESCAHLEKLGWAKVTYLPVDQYGMVQLTDINQAITPETVLVSVMYVNNEVGTIQPIPEIGKFIKELNQRRKAKNQQLIRFHTDATQAIQYLDCQVDNLGVDFLSFTGHKFYAPKGIGAVYVRKGTLLVRQQDGGGQENRLRSGTENVPLIVGLAQSVELISQSKPLINIQLTKLRDKLIRGVLKIPGAKLTGHPQKRAPHIASFTIQGVEGEAVVLMLSELGIACSTGSACNSNLLAPSHVLSAMGIPAEVSHGSIRFSLGKNTTGEEIQYLLTSLPNIVQRLRKMAPKPGVEGLYV